VNGHRQDFWGLIPDGGGGIFLATSSDSFQDLPLLLSGGARGSQWVSSWNMKLIAHLHPVLRLRMCGAFISMPSHSVA
jgi:hypothetical protein